MNAIFPRGHSSFPRGRSLVSLFGVVVTGAVALTACTGGNGTDPLSCDDSDGIAFCADRIDDDCDDVDEACPSTQPADAAPPFSCDGGAVPASVLAHATMPTNEQVAGGCVFVYQGETGAFYLAVDITDGEAPRGPMGTQTGLCAQDTSARRHVFMTTSPTADCEDVAYVYPDELSNQVLSVSCRKMVRNLSSNDPGFDPDIQFLPGDLDVQEARLARFDVAEVACLRINNSTGAPYRTDEIFVTQAEAPFVQNASFTPR